MKKIPLTAFLFFIIFSLLLGCKALAQTEVFNPNYITDEADILATGTMTAAEIQSFLASKNSYLANYSCPDLNGNSITAANAIFQVATTNRVNPRFLLVLLQKEQGLVENPNPKPSQLDWATGYGCPDNSPCNERWRGFYKQINSASLQFRDYLENPHLYRYRAGQTYTFVNTNKEPLTVTPVNNATAALYNYTPHVYNGNYNFWLLWRRYFKKEGYPDGTLLQVKGEPGVWLIQDGKKRPFHTRGALVSRFDPKKIIPINNKAELDKYPTGAPIKFAQYSIVRTPDKKLYLLVDDKKRLFASDEAFRKIGYNPSEIINASPEDLAGYTDGKDITVSDAYPTGALLKNKVTGELFWVEENTKAPILSDIVLKTKFANKKIITVDAATLDKYQAVAAVKLSSGELVRLDGGFMSYAVEGSVLRPIVSAQDFEALGYKWSNITIVDPRTFLLYTIGDTLKPDNIISATSTTR